MRKLNIMIYPGDFESKVGFDSIRDHVSALCQSRMGKEKVAEMSFSDDFGIVRHNLINVNEMVRIVREDLPLTVSGFHDVLPFLGEIKAISSYMSAERLNRLKTTMELMSEVARFFRDQIDEETGESRFPNLSSDMKDISVFPSLVSVISNAVNKFGEVKDNASPALYEIRGSIRGASGAMQRAMRKVMDSAVSHGIVDKDASPSIRDGRLVIPVQAGNKYAISGIVHDESASGKTVYIEPAEVIQAGNRLRQLQLDEKREIVNILIGIADQIRPNIGAIEESCHKLALLDFIQAKAKYAIDIDAAIPHLNKKPEIEWYHAVHPGLLMSLRQQGRNAVPLNITLTPENRILIISGPNAGGKSVCLKTVATVQYMMQCGLLPPLYSNSHMGIFRSIFIDIGDEQSFENDLSTYSSHLKNMKYFMQYADDRTIILADEMGSGTEPQIGGAMAQAILQKLGKEGCYGVVTTHYQNLKTFADTEAGFVNGAMLYDRQHLQPTFELSIGNPGSSFAIDIAVKTGLPRDVIEKAKEIVGSDYVNLDKYLSDIARDRRYWANKRLNIKEKESKLDGLLEKYEETAGDLKSQRKQILNDALREAKEIVAGANARIERTILEIRNAQAEKEKTKAVRRELNDYASALSDEDSVSENTPKILQPLRHKSKKARTNIRPISDPVVKKEIGVGDYVRMEGSGTVGEVLSIQGKKAEIAFGALRTIVSLEKLSPAQKPKKKLADDAVFMSSSSDGASRERQLNFKNEIDVRGMRADEALQAVTYFLDDAIQFNAGKVRILHGTGHGILKTLIRQQLKANTAVTHFEDEDVRFGGAGITVVDLA